MLVEELRKRTLESGMLERILQGTGIEILKDFLENWDNVIEFHRSYYPDGEPNTVLCGINPGRLGAGKTGIPFTDFEALAKLLPGIERSDAEGSARFFYEVVHYFGARNFYRAFYVTNVSWLGYVKAGKNINFDALPLAAQEEVVSLFSYEMSCTEPEVVISMGKVVKPVVESVLGSSVHSANLLPHPNYCKFPNNTEKCFKQYIDVLEPYVESAN